MAQAPDGPENGGGVLAPPKGPEELDASKKEELYGEMGRPVVLGNLTADVKKLVDEGWTKNAFNQYVSDLISVHRAPGTTGKTMS